MVTTLTESLLILGAFFLLSGTIALTWLVATIRTERWRRRAEDAAQRANQAKEALQRLRAQNRQRRQPIDTLILPVIQDRVLEEADQVLDSEANTVVMGAITPYAAHLMEQLGRRPR